MEKWLHGWSLLIKLLKDTQDKELLEFFYDNYKVEKICQFDLDKDGHIKIDSMKVNKEIIAIRSKINGMHYNNININQDYKINTLFKHISEEYKAKSELLVEE